MTVIQEYLNPVTLMTIAVVITTLLISGALSPAAIKKARARNIIDDLALQSSQDFQSDAKPCKNCTPSPSLHVVERSGPTIQIPFENDGTTSASCGPGEIATGGGYIADVPLIVEVSHALPNNAGWTSTAHNGGSTNSLSVSAFAECATITS
jgi:hypothetical protein